MPQSPKAPKASAVEVGEGFDRGPDAVAQLGGFQDLDVGAEAQELGVGVVGGLDGEDRSGPAVGFRTGGGARRFAQGGAREAVGGARGQAYDGVAAVEAALEVFLVGAPVRGEVEVRRRLELLVVEVELEDLVDAVGAGSPVPAEAITYQRPAFSTSPYGSRRRSTSVGARQRR